MKFIDYFKVGFATTYNIILNAVSLGRYLWLEGRVRSDVFRNWARRFRYRPKRFVQPNSEKEMVELVKNSKSLRVSYPQTCTEPEEIGALLVNPS